MPKLSLVYLDLKIKQSNDSNNLIIKNIMEYFKFYSFDLQTNNFLNDDETNRENLPNFVYSEVDWSEFYTHELYDTVMIELENLNNYKNERQLADINE